MSWTSKPPAAPGVHTSGADLLPEIYVFELWPRQGRELHETPSRWVNCNIIMPPSGGAAPKRSESGEDELCNVLFRWTGGGMSCSVQGSWNGWVSVLLIQRRCIDTVQAQRFANTSPYTIDAHAGKAHTA